MKWSYKIAEVLVKTKGFRQVLTLYKQAKNVIKFIYSASQKLGDKDQDQNYEITQMKGW